MVAVLVAVVRRDGRATGSGSGGFCEEYRGYGGEDTDVAATVRDLGGALFWVGGAPAHHQHHPTQDPPVQHLAAIVRNAAVFHRRWGWWPMTGWLERFRAAGPGRLRRGDVAPGPSPGPQRRRRRRRRSAARPRRRPTIAADDRCESAAAPDGAAVQRQHGPTAAAIASTSSAGTTRPICGRRRRDAAPHRGPPRSKATTGVPRHRRLRRDQPERLVPGGGHQHRRGPAHGPRRGRARPGGRARSRRRPSCGSTSRGEVLGVEGGPDQVAGGGRRAPRPPRAPGAGPSRARCGRTTAARRRPVRAPSGAGRPRCGRPRRAATQRRPLAGGEAADAVKAAEPPPASSAEVSHGVGGVCRRRHDRRPAACSARDRGR